VRPDPWVTAVSSLDARISANPAFAGIAIDDDVVVVRWKQGSSPDAALEAAFPSLTMRQEFVPFTEQELVAETQRITKSLGRGDVGISVIGPAPDLSGIEIHPSKAEAGLRRTTGDAQVQQPSLQDFGIEQGAIPLTVTEPLAAGTTARLTTDPDRTGFPIRTGGQRIELGAAACTSGIPAYIVQSGARVMVTAGHCGSVGSSWTDGAGNFYGRMTTNFSSPTTPSFDYAYLGSHSTGFQVGVIQRGPLANGSVTPSRQMDYIAPYQGLSVCSSGSFSGEVCQVVVQAVGQSVFYKADNQWYDNLVSTTSTGTYAGWGDGDSGGTVHRPHATGGGTTIVGIVSGSSFAATRPCAASTTRTCYRDGWFAPFEFLAATKGIGLDMSQ
jgi:hypothetical protein